MFNFSLGRGGGKKLPCDDRLTKLLGLPQRNETHINSCTLFEKVNFKKS